MRQPTSEGESMAVSQGIDTVILCTMCLLRHWAVLWEDLLGREVWCGVVGVVQLWWLDRLETAAVTGTSRGVHACGEHTRLPASQAWP